MLMTVFGSKLSVKQKKYQVSMNEIVVLGLETFLSKDKKKLSLDSEPES